MCIFPVGGERNERGEIRMWWLKLLGPIIGGAGSLYFAWRFLKKNYAKLKSYYSIVVILIEAIEDIEDATDLIPNNALAVAQMVKAIVSRSLNREDKKRLDLILSSRGLLNKKGGGN